MWKWNTGHSCDGPSVALFTHILVFSHIWRIWRNRCDNFYTYFSRTKSYIYVPGLHVWGKTWYVVKVTFGPSHISSSNVLGEYVRDLFCRAVTLAFERHILQNVEARTPSPTISKQKGRHFLPKFLSSKKKRHEKIVGKWHGIIFLTLYHPFHLFFVQTIVIEAVGWIQYKFQIWFCILEI